ncbi:putative HIT-like bis(5'-adenosyl)-triphosphatase [Hamiltosporidium tvaerminnensis]|uniref:Putative HIT-like bis(5'-adenosyl)-triphosphatase n=1 Tax=Hamiltosporidium tvaerminnensis TaxID=1176355 RepID=A0A4Q9L976_9MICR|nr:Dinucleoside triphosphate hydrolase [Hamiltosporidium tvaerminnensis]TBU03805.1 putative HIT-like bis(5'-adenosyl)-triphosphatase [Hamiltosporidium tvaerminnensis]TBU12293.1 putative HIT-like bis(5'-adenosyl)-triphosphatase [Hamiltosporidium tvaerminnensis]
MKFGTHEIPEDHIIFKTKYSFVFTNIRPFLPNHLLVSPIAEKMRISELTKEENEDIFETVRNITTVLSKIYEGFTINVQDGVSAGQKVLHVHVHVVPRKNKDLKYNDDIYKEGALDYERVERSYEEMKQETLYLRSLFKKYI